MRIGTSQGGGGEKCPEGKAVGCLVAVWDIGRQKTTFKGEEKVKPQLILVWEMEKRDSKGRRFVLYDFVTNSAGENSALTNRVAALVDKVSPAESDYETDLLVGRFAYLTIAAPFKEGGFPRIKTAAALQPGIGTFKPETVVNPAAPPKAVENARAKAVGGWKPQSPTPTAKPAVAASQGPSRPDPEAPDLGLNNEPPF